MTAAVAAVIAIAMLLCTFSARTFKIIKTAHFQNERNGEEKNRTNRKTLNFW